MKSWDAGEHRIKSPKGFTVDADNGFVLFQWQVAEDKKPQNKIPISRLLDCVSCLASWCLMPVIGGISALICSNRVLSKGHYELV